MGGRCTRGCRKLLYAWALSAADTLGSRLSATEPGLDSRGARRCYTLRVAHPCFAIVLWQLTSGGARTVR
eukprot:10351068-Alexandrium_andersonii.AAC.1